MPPPWLVTLEAVTKYRIDLYRRVPPLGEPIPILVEPVNVADGVLAEEDIKWSTRQVFTNQDGVHQGCRLST